MVLGKSFCGFEHPPIDLRSRSITKHGILIVEFANHLRKEIPLNEAIIKAASLRLRPILMTTGAMMFGAIPLMLSHDAGHETQRAIGIVLVGGLGFGTLFTLFVLPTTYCIIKSLTDKKGQGHIIS